MSPLHSPQPSSTKRKSEAVEDVASQHGDEARDPDARPAKSQKTFEKHEIHWHLDGNLLLQIGKTRFRVHRSRLASESEWFQSLVDADSGNLPEQDKVEISAVLKSAETVNGVPLYYLDAWKKAPNADEFAALLTAMNQGIDYVYTPPTLEHIALLYSAAYFYRAYRYRDFVEKYLKRLFPDDHTSLEREPCIYQAEQGVLIGRRYDLTAILRRSFYNLARAKQPSDEDNILLDDEWDDDDSSSDEYDEEPADESDDELEDEVAEENEETASSGDEDEADDAESELVNDIAPLGQLAPHDLICLLKIQKFLSLEWDKINAALALTCERDTCVKTHRPPDKVATIKAQYPFDPILGIQALIDERSIWRLSHYCPEAKKIVQDELLDQRDCIWRGLKKLIL